MNTKDIEEIVKAQRPKLLPTEAEMDAYEQRLITTLTRHHEAEVERAIKEEIEVARSNFVEILENLREMVDGTDRMVEEYIDDMIVGLTLTPTKTDKQ